MTEDAAVEDEPSIEEILDSIRQIISDDEDDGEEAVAAEPAPEPEESPAPEPEPVAEAEPEQSAEEEAAPESDADDVIELTDIVEDEQSAEEEEMAAEPETPEAAPEPEPEPEPEPPPAEEPEEDVMDIDLTGPDDDAIDTPEPEPVAAEEPEGSILTDKAQGAALDGFTNLVKKTAVESGGITLEDIVRSELNPMLRDWLDRHLPLIIERLVQEELQKISKRALEDQD